MGVNSFFNEIELSLPKMADSESSIALESWEILNVSVNQQKVNFSDNVYLKKPIS